MLRPIIKEDGITESERYLAKLSEHTFLGLWSYPNVYTNEGYNQNNEGKELCDLLVVFDNKVIIFSDKDIKFNDDIDIEISWKRWFKKSVIKSAGQLYGAESWILKRPERLFLDKKCTSTFPIQLPVDDIDIYLVAVTKNSSKPAENYYNKFAEGSSGTLMQAYCLSQTESLNHPFIVGDLNPSKTFVHVLDELTLDLLLTELDTINDFTTYLTIKEKAIRDGYLQQVSGEEDLLAHYFTHINKTVLGDIPRLKGEFSKHSIAISEGAWEEFTRSPLNNMLEKHRSKSLYWDELISLFSEHILNASVGLGKELPFEMHERAVNYLASENRISRGYLCEAFEDKLRSVPSNLRSGRLVFSPLYKDRLYVFLFYPRENNLLDEEYRLQRKNCMEAYSLVAKYQNSKAMHIVVIATETKNSKSRSEDIYSVHYDIPLSIDEKKEAKRVMKECNILNHTKNLNSKNISSHERPYINMSPNIGRNDKCTCGSGKKYKKCCLETV